MEHKVNSNGQAETTADSCKIAESLKSSQPIANAAVSGWAVVVNLLFE